MLCSCCCFLSNRCWGRLPESGLTAAGIWFQFKGKLGVVAVDTEEGTGVGKGVELVSEVVGEVVAEVVGVVLVEMSAVVVELVVVVSMGSSVTVPAQWGGSWEFF